MAPTVTSQAVAEALGAIKEHLTLQDRSLARIETKTTETNHRVTALEVHREREEAVKQDRHNRNWSHKTIIGGVSAGTGGLLVAIGHALGLW